MNNWFFLAINFIMIGLQILIVFVGGKAFSVVRLDARGWGYSLAFGFLSIPVGAAIRCIPDELIRRLIPDYLVRRTQKTPELTIEDEEAAQYTFPKPLADVKEELSFLKKVKGGRINNLRFKVEQAKDSFMTRSRSGSRSRSNSIPHTPTGEEGPDALPPPTPESRKGRRSNRSRSNSALGATAVMAGIIAGSVAGWSPIERSSQGDDGWGRGRVDLEATSGVELHPGTKATDNVIVEEPASLDEAPSQTEGVGPAKTGQLPPTTSAEQSKDGKDNKP